MIEIIQRLVRHVQGREPEPIKTIGGLMIPESLIHTAATRQMAHDNLDLLLNHAKLLPENVHDVTPRFLDILNAGVEVRFAVQDGNKLYLCLEMKQ